MTMSHLFKDHPFTPRLDQTLFVKKRNFLNLGEGEVEDVWKYTPLIIFVAFLAGFINVTFFFPESLRLDEAQSLFQVSRSPREILTIVAKDVHVPLYHLLLHLWLTTFGFTLEMARLLSLLFFLLSIFVLYALVRMMYGNREAFFVALLFSFSPFMQWYGSEARMYSLLILLVLLNQFCFLALYRSHHWMPLFWVGYLISAFLGMFTHYFFFLVLLAEAIFFFIIPRAFPKHAGWKFFAIVLFLLICFLPWVYYVVSLGSAANTHPIFGPPTSIDFFNVLLQILLGYHSDYFNQTILSSWPLGVLFGFFMLQKTKRISFRSIFFLLAVAIPLLTTFLFSSFIEPVYQSRYLIVILPVLLIFIVHILFEMRLMIAKFALVGILILFLISLDKQVKERLVPVKEPYRQAIDILNHESTAQDVILLSAPFTVYPVEYYYDGPSKVMTFPVWNRYVPGAIPPFSESDLHLTVDSLKKVHQSIWLFLSYDQGYEKVIKTYFDDNFEKLSLYELSPTMTLYHYRFRYYTPDTQEVVRGYEQQRRDEEKKRLDQKHTNW